MLGALVMRAVMIVLGAVLITKFSWIIYIFGAFLLLTGIKMLLVHTPFKIDTVLSLGVIVGILAVSVIASLMKPKKEEA